MHPAEDHANETKGENAIREFRASLASFAFPSNLPASNLRKNDNVSKIRRKRTVPSDEPDVEFDSKLSCLRSPSPKKKKRGYAAPETYAHLRMLQDILAEGLDGTPPCI